MGLTINDKNLIIKKVNNDYLPLANEKLFYQDSDSGEIMVKRPFFFTRARDWNYYVINTNLVYDKNIIVMTVNELGSPLSIDLEIRYKFKFREPLNTDFLRVLINAGRNSSGFDNQMINWVNEFSASNKDFINRFFQLKNSLVAFLKQLYEKVGIYLELVVDIKDDMHEEKLHITGGAAIRIKDYHGKITMNYIVDLELIETAREKAILTLANGNLLENKVKEFIKRTISNDVDLKLQELYFQAKATISSALEDKLIDLLEVSGLRPVFVTLSIHLPNVPPEREQVTVNVLSTTRDKFNVSVDHRLILSLKDLGGYYSSEITNLKGFVHNELERLTQDYIFDKDFTDLITDFDGEEIKNGMRQEIAKIGYEIKQLTTIPDLEKIVPKHVAFEIGEQDEFSTLNDALKVKLNIVVNGKVNDVSKMKWFINQQTSSDLVTQKIKESVVDEVRKILHAVDPESYYLDFYNSRDKSITSISSCLSNRIKEKLSDDFGINNAEIHCKQLETDLVKKFNSFKGVSHNFEVVSASKEIRYDVIFEVTGMSKNGWPVFKMKYDALKGKEFAEILNEIGLRMKNYLELWLDGLGFDFIQIKNKKFVEKWNETIVSCAEKMSQDFGVVVKINSLKRQLTSYEKIELKKREEQRAHLENVRKLALKSDLDRRELEMESKTNKMKSLIKQVGEETILLDDLESASDLLSEEFDGLYSFDNDNIEFKKLEEGTLSIANLLGTGSGENNEIDTNE